MAAKFAVMNDQSGDQKDCTLKEWTDLQAQGYRIVDAPGYDAAVALQADDEDALTPSEQRMADQGNADAAKAAERDFPEAKPSAADKPKADRK